MLHNKQSRARLAFTYEYDLAAGSGMYISRRDLALNLLVRVAE